MLLIDTHVLIWLEEGSERLGKNALRAINKALVGQELAVATTTFWEIAMLIEKQRVVFGLALDAWRRDLLRNGLQEIPLLGAIAVRAGQLQDVHGDPADRMIIATAIEKSATLMTADRKILAYQHLPEKIDASR